MLVAAGANLAIQDNEGNTPKVLALLADDHSLAAYLESKWIANLLNSFKYLSSDLNVGTFSSLQIRSGST